MNENRTTTADKIRSMTEDEYVLFKKEYAGMTIRVLVNKTNNFIDRDKIISGLYSLGVSQKIISKVLGISQQAISKIISNKNK